MQNQIKIRKRSTRKKNQNQEAIDEKEERWAAEAVQTYEEKIKRGRRRDVSGRLLLRGGTGAGGSRGHGRHIILSLSGRSLFFTEGLPLPSSGIIIQGQMKRDG